MSNHDYLKYETILCLHFCSFARWTTIVKPDKNSHSVSTNLKLVTWCLSPMKPWMNKYRHQYKWSVCAITYCQGLRGVRNLIIEAWTQNLIRILRPYIEIDYCKAPSTRMRIFLKTEVFFSVLALRPHVKRRFWHVKTEVFKNAVQSGGFRKRRFRVYVWTGENEGFRYVWTQIFSKTEKNTSVLKNIRIRVDRA